MDSEVQLLHRALVDAIARCRHDVDAQPVTVGEILNELLPYRSARSLVGFEMNADYEHALMRLLAGVDGLVRLEPEDAREHLARELTAPNPDVRIVREYSAFDVWVSALPETPGEADERAPEVDLATPVWLADPPAPGPPLDPWLEAPAESPAPAAPVEVARAAAAPATPPDPSVAAASPAGRGRVTAVVGGTRAGVRAAGPAPAASAAPAVPAPAAAPSRRAPRAAGADAAAPAPALADAADAVAAGAAPAQGAAPATLEQELPPATGTGECAFCHGALPKGKVVRYCPFCGADQQLRPCPRCGETLEPAWRYCVSCGAAAPGGAPA